MATFDFFFRWACYYHNASYREVNGIKVADKLLICKLAKSVLFIFGTEFTQRSYRSCRKWTKVSVRSKVRGFYGTFSNFRILNAYSTKAHLGPWSCQNAEAPPAPAPGVADSVQLIVVSATKSQDWVGRATSKSMVTRPSGLMVPSTIVTTPSKLSSKAPLRRTSNPKKKKHKGHSSCQGTSAVHDHVNFFSFVSLKVSVHFVRNVIKMHSGWDQIVKWYRMPGESARTWGTGRRSCFVLLPRRP